MKLATVSNRCSPILKLVLCTACAAAVKRTLMCLAMIRVIELNNVEVDVLKPWVASNEMVVVDHSVCLEVVRRRLCHGLS